MTPASPFAHGPGSTHEAGCVDCALAAEALAPAGDPPAPATFTVYGRALSMNHAYPTNRSGRRFSSPALKKWKAVVASAAWAAKVRRAGGPVSVRATVYFPSRRGDLDNVAKPLLDALKGIAYIDDRQVEELHLVRALDRERPRVEVSVTERGAR